MSYTDQQLNDFILQDDLAFNPNNSTNSIKTNLFIFSRNFNILQTYLAKLKAFVKRLDDLFNGGLGEIIVNNLQVNKISLIISGALNVNEIVQQIANTTTFQIERKSQFLIEISNITTPSWITDNLVIQIKNIDGVIVYPVITTNDNKILINFADEIQTNYKLFII